MTRTVITLPPGERLASADQPTVALSPDGTELAYVAIREGIQQIHLRSMDSLESKAIAGTEGAVSPFFSPDGQSLGFFANGKLKKISVNGGFQSFSVMPTYLEGQVGAIRARLSLRQFRTGFSSGCPNREGTGRR